MYYFAPRLYLPRPDRLYRQWLSRPQRPEVDLTAIGGVLSEYDLELAAPAQVLSGGNRSYSLLLDTSQGKKVLRKYKASLDESTIIQEHSILAYLAQIEFPAPRLVATRPGKSLVRRNNEYYALFDFIEGGFQYHNYMLFPGQARQFISLAGEMLAGLHLALKDFAPQGYNPDGFKSQHEDRWRDLEWIMDKLAHCVTATSRLKANPGPGQADRLWRQAGSIEQSLVHLETLLRPAELSRSIIHADYGPFNLLFRKNAPAIILDFEIARLDWRLADLILAWYRFGHDKLGFRLNKMKWLLEAYQRRFPLEEGELRLAPAVWQYLNLRQCVVNWDHYCQNGADSYLAGARRNLEMVDWMKTNQANFLENLARKEIYVTNQ